MDPDEALRLAREAASELLDADDDGNFTDPETTNLGQLIEAFTALDGWIAKGGFLPKDWELPGQARTHGPPSPEGATTMQGILHLNGYSVIAMTPATMSDQWVVLAALPPGDSGTPYVTAWLHPSQLPDPNQWWTGHYFERLEDAVEDFHQRSSTDPAGFRRIIDHLTTVHTYQCVTCRKAGRDVTVETPWHEGVTERQAHAAHKGFGLGLGNHNAADFEEVTR